MTEERLTVEQAAAELGLSEAGVRFRLRSGLMSGEFIAGRVWLIPRSAVNQAKMDPPPRGRPRRRRGAQGR